MWRQAPGQFGKGRIKQVYPQGNMTVLCTFNGKLSVWSSDILCAWGRSLWGWWMSGFKAIWSASRIITDDKNSAHFPKRWPQQFLPLSFSASEEYLPSPCLPSQELQLNLGPWKILIFLRLSQVSLVLTRSKPGKKGKQTGIRKIVNINERMTWLYSLKSPFTFK